MNDDGDEIKVFAMGKIAPAEMNGEKWEEFNSASHGREGNLWIGLHQLEVKRAGFLATLTRVTWITISGYLLF